MLPDFLMFQDYIVTNRPATVKQATNQIRFLSYERMLDPRLIEPDKKLTPAQIFRGILLVGKSSIV